MEKEIDRSPHEVFVELSELQPIGVGGFEWKERCRWIKYEEDVLEHNDRWGKPHVASLNFDSIYCLRKGLEHGAVLLDLDEQDMPGMVEHVTNHMVACNQIPKTLKDAITKLLLLKQKHLKENVSALRRASRTLYNLGITPENPLSSQSSVNYERRRSSRKSLGNIFHGGSGSNTPRKLSVKNTALQVGENSAHRRGTLPKIEIEMDSESKDKFPINTELLRKIPEGTEAASVLVGTVEYLSQPTIAFIRLAEGVVMDNLIEVPIPLRFLIVILGPKDTMDYYEVGRSMATLMADKHFHETAYQAYSRNQLLAGVNDFLSASILLPPSECVSRDLIDVDEIRSKTQEMNRRTMSMRKKTVRLAQESKTNGAGAPIQLTEVEEAEPPKRDPLERKGIIFYGLVQDVKCRYSQYVSDLKDGINLQVLSATIFIFFASLSPSVTFGGMYADRTNRYIGVGETLLATSINGIIFALFAAQPLLIIGATGPLMIFDMSLLQFCNSMEIDYLSIRVWVGIWMVVVGLLVDAFEAVAIVKRFTRFTEEIFSSLVCLIFIIGAVEKIIFIFQMNPPWYSPLSDISNTSYDVTEDTNGTQIDDDLLEEESSRNGTDMLPSKKSPIKNQPNTALFSLILMLGTLLIALRLKKLRNSKFLGRTVRRNLGDFGVPIAIFLMVMMDYFVPGIYTEKLSMPKGLTPSNAEVRGWIINPFGVVRTLPVWCMFAAAPAGLLLFILIFLEENICHLILSKPERCLKKGSGFHLDILLSCLINTVSGFIGAPFMGPACVRTIAHMSALTVTSSNVAPGESPKIVGCIEQRLSAFFVALVIGLAVMLYSVLNLVPTAVLLGVFMYMGVSAAGGIQMYQRFILFFMPVKYHPQTPTQNKVRTWKMHIFTIIQLMLLGVLWIVSKSPASLCVPFILMCLIPLRIFLLPYLFTNPELIALDGAEQQTSEQIAEEEPDFYETIHHLPTQIETPHPHET